MKRSLVIAAVFAFLALLAFGLWQIHDRQAGDAPVASQPSSSGAETATAPTPGAGGEAGTSGGDPAPEQGEPATGVGPQTAALPPADSDPPAAGPGLVPPSFDVVRVEPNGDAVMAGRAPPASAITITDNGEVYGRAESNRRGEWTFVSEFPLAPGNHEISLWAETPDGIRIESEEVVVIAVPEPQIAEAGGPAQTPVTVLIPKSGEGPSTVLQAPRGEGIAVNDLVLEAIDYDVAGRLIVSGRATPGGQVIAYLDNRPLGGAVVSEEGRWSVTSPEALAPGLHELRIDQIDSGGKVIARVQTPLSRSQLLTQLPGDQFFIVQPGNSLWRIARGAYGTGQRYTMIFEANKDQIRNPDLIYPGQIFVLPSSE
ncbi:MAG: LysM peptidoglycan-binding domain-containing protein [Kiloniellales bacterium]|nr:LysM peptidoglycan-binding domain-containing protein [Kiloniellales bacterium]